MITDDERRGIHVPEYALGKKLYPFRADLQLDLEAIVIKSPELFIAQWGSAEVHLLNEEKSGRRLMPRLPERLDRVVHINLKTFQEGRERLACHMETPMGDLYSFCYIQDERMGVLFDRWFRPGESIKQASRFKIPLVQSLLQDTAITFGLAKTNPRNGL